MVILLNQTQRLWEKRMWPASNERLDCLTDSRHRHCRKRIDTSLENTHVNISGLQALERTCSSVRGSQYRQGVVLVFLNKLSSKLPAFFWSSSSSSSATSAWVVSAITSSHTSVQNLQVLRFVKYKTAFRFLNRLYLTFTHLFAPPSQLSQF